MKGFVKGIRGFTLIELMVVMTIMSILAAIVVPQLTGVTTTGRGSVRTTDISTVQTAVDRYLGEHPKGQTAGWPTSAGTPPASDTTVPIDWGAAFIKDGKANVFGRDYAKSATLSHSGAHRTAIDTVSTLTDGKVSITEADAASGEVAVTGTAPNFSVTVTPTVSGSTWTKADSVTPAKYPVWRINSKGIVVLNLTNSEY